MYRPEVTLGVCVRNCEGYIEEAIGSIINQDFPHELMEMIFVDDGSEDDTLSIIHKSTLMIDIPVSIGINQEARILLGKSSPPTGGSLPGQQPIITY